MNFDREWTQFALDAEIEHFGASRIVNAHNALRSEVARLRAEIERCATPAVVPVGAGLSEGDAKRVEEIRDYIESEKWMEPDTILKSGFAKIVRDLLAIIEKLTASVDSLRARYGDKKTRIDLDEALEERDAEIEKLTARGEAREGLEKLATLADGMAIALDSIGDAPCRCDESVGFQCEPCYRKEVLASYRAHRASLSGRDAEDGERKEVR